MKVYIVTALVDNGSYDDSEEICGVYSTREKAKEWLKLYNGNAIKEFGIDDALEHPPGKFYFLIEMTEDGTVVVCGYQSIKGAKPVFSWEPGPINTVRFSIWAEDDKKAIQIANEKRAILIAMGKWTTELREWQKRQGK